MLVQNPLHFYCYKSPTNRIRESRVTVVGVNEIQLFHLLSPLKQARKKKKEMKASRGERDLLINENF